MKNFFGYTRVSTVKQGTQGVSLQEQRSSIEYYAQTRDFVVIEWFEERETAAKYGRPIFTDMMKRLRRGEATGVIIHKIDRSARNLRDWVELSELADTGVAIHFSNEGVDLSSTMSRYSADIHAASAAHYIRNLREETLKGMYGRLKQGLYPWQAPIGYLDQGRGRAKTIDPVHGPLVRHAFDLYGQEAHTLRTLTNEMATLGLRNHRDRMVAPNGLNRLLRNSFYMGVIEVKTNGQTFNGIHEPLVSADLFSKVQAILDGKTSPRTCRHDFIFRKLLTCRRCDLSLIGERQKGRVYYRCHTVGCRSALREDAVEERVVEALSRMVLSDKEHRTLMTAAQTMTGDADQRDRELLQSLRLKQAGLAERLNRLTDALIDGMIDKTDHSARRRALLLEMRAIEQRIADREEGREVPTDMVEEFLERAKSLVASYRLALPHEKSEFVREATSNCLVSGKDVEIAWLNEYRALAERPKPGECDPVRDGARTSRKLVEGLFSAFSERESPMSPSARRSRAMSI